MYFVLLDILRFASSVAVFFHHTFHFYYGRLGVYLFFIISGFVIHFSLRKGVKEFIIGRFIRLYPLFWVCCTLTFLVTLFYNTNVSFQKYLMSMLMFNDGKIATMVDGSYWTLTFELLFYFYITVFIYIFSEKKVQWFYVGWLTIAFLSFFLTVDQHLISKLLSVRFAPYFVFGGMLALLIDRYKDLSKNEKASYVGVLVVAASMPYYISSKLRAQVDTITNFTGSFDSDEMKIVLSFFIIMPLAVLLSYYSFANGRHFRKVAFILGGITYPLYLLHWKIGSTVITHYGYPYGKVTIFSVTVAVIIFAVSALFSFWDEKFRKRLKSVLFGEKRG